MKTPSSLVAVLALAACCVAACSAEVASPNPHGDGALAGGTQTGGATDPGTTSGATDNGGSASSSGGGGTGSSSGGATSGTPDAGVTTTPVVDSGSGVDTGSGYFIDTGAPTGIDASPAPSGPPGSCGNPLCASDGNECGCTATDSNGNTIQLGCQAGGECVCVEDQQVTDQPFDENGACSDQSSMQQQFLQYCTCN